MSETLTQRRPALVGAAMKAGLIVGGVVLAMIVMSIFVSDLPVTWFVYLLGAVIVTPMVLSVAHPRRLLLGLTILSLQVNANVYFLEQGRSVTVGTSGPTGIELPLSTLLCALLLMMEAARFDTDAPRVVIPEAFKRPLLYYLGAIILSGAATSERRLCLFYINQQLLSVIVLVAVANAIRDERDVKLVVNLLLAAAAIQAVVFFAESATGMSFNPEGHVREVENVKEHGGTFHTRSNGLGGLLMPLVVLAVPQFLRTQSAGGRRFSGLALALGAAGLIATMARAAWVGCAVGVVFVLWAGGRRGLIHTTRVALLAIGAIAVVAIFAQSLADRVSSDHMRDYEERKALMAMAWRVYVAHPLIGCGAGSYATVFRSYLDSDLLGRWLYVVHNRFLLTAAEMGTVGIAAFLAILVAWFRTAYSLIDAKSQSARMLGLGLCGAIVAIVWHMYWDTLTGFPIDGVLYTMMGLTAAAARLEEDSAAAALPRSDRSPAASGRMGGVALVPGAAG